MTRPMAMDTGEAALKRQLARVRSRLRHRSLMLGLRTGLVCSTVLCCLGIASRWWYSLPTPDWRLVAAVVGLPTVAGVVIAACRGCSWLLAAATVDRHFRLKDQTLSAVSFLGYTERSAIHKLQLSQTVDRLNLVDVRLSVRQQIPRRLAAACLLMAGAVLIWLSPVSDLTSPAEGDRSSVMSPQLMRVAEQIGADLQLLGQIVEQADVSELRPLLTELNQQLNLLLKSDQLPVTVLSALSEMQQAIADRQAAFNLNSMGAHLQQLAGSLAEVGEFQAAAEQMQLQEFAKAGRSLEKVRPQRITADEAERASSGLTVTAESMQQAGLNDLSDLVSELSDSLARHAPLEIGEQARQLAQALDRQSRHQELADLLKMQFDRLSEYKQLARHAAEDDRKLSAADQQSGAGDAGRGAGSGGSNAGSGSIQNSARTLTELESRRQLTRLTGQLNRRGAGVRETVRTTESDQQPQLDTREIFAEYFQRSQQEVQSEAIPLTQREVIRRYFESLRPASGDRQRSDPGSVPPTAENQSEQMLPRPHNLLPEQ